MRAKARVVVALTTTVKTASLLPERLFGDGWPLAGLAVGSCGAGYRSGSGVPPVGSASPLMDARICSSRE